MTDAPLVSTFIALALVPVAFFFTHALISGKRRLPFHRWTGTIAIVWDLSLSIFYMLLRLFGADVEGNVLDINPDMIAYFAVHGMIAVVVITMELVMIATGFMQVRKKKPYPLHKKLAMPLFVVWWAAFLSGEIVYLVYYVL